MPPPRLPTPSPHRVDNEIEFFTALDDLKSDDETGSAHMGSLEYNSATYYRYINLDLGQLADSLGNTGLADAVSAFIKALYIAVPPPGRPRKPACARGLCPHLHPQGARHAGQL